MRIGQILKVTVIGLGIVTLAACAAKGPNTNEGMSEGSTFQAFSSGLGERSSFDSGDKEVTYTTSAPHDQTYYFDFDNTNVHNEYLTSIQAQAKYLADHANARVLVAGNTDERGSAEYNIALGERRADTIANLLRISGVNSGQMRIVSYGQERPAAEGHDEAAWKYNRRVEILYENVG